MKFNTIVYINLSPTQTKHRSTSLPIFQTLTLMCFSTMHRAIRDPQGRCFDEIMQNTCFKRESNVLLPASKSPTMTQTLWQPLFVAAPLEAIHALAIICLHAPWGMSTSNGARSFHVSRKYVDGSREKWLHKARVRADGARGRFAAGRGSSDSSPSFSSEASALHGCLLRWAQSTREAGQQV